MLIEIENEDVKKFYRHVFLNMNYKTEKTFMINEQYELNQNMGDIYELIDTSRLNLVNKSDLSHIIKMSISVMIQNIIDKFTQNLSSDEVVHNYRTQLDLLKRGFQKR